MPSRLKVLLARDEVVNQVKTVVMAELFKLGDQPSIVYLVYIDVCIVYLVYIDVCVYI
jgi:hypothetical protein